VHVLKFCLALLIQALLRSYIFVWKNVTCLIDLAWAALVSLMHLNKACKNSKTFCHFADATQYTIFFLPVHCTSTA